MERRTQLSVIVSPTMKMLVERYVRTTGVKKSHLVQEALLHHLAALDALPGDVFSSPRLVVSHRSGKELVKRLTGPPHPNEQLRKLLRNRD